MRMTPTPPPSSFAPLALLAGCLLSAAAWAEPAMPEIQASDLTGGNIVHEHFANGLDLLIQEDHKAPVAVVQVWYRVGAVDEPTGWTGISHMLEHMMFKGTQKHGAGQYSRIIAGEGGSENAFTTADATAYFAKVASDRLPVVMALEADRMANLLLDAEEFAKERMVVAEERHMRTDDNPDSLLYEQLQAAAYQVYPYHHPVIGWPGDITGWSHEQLVDWYQRFYDPANATVVVVGDVDPAQTIALARKTFGAVAHRRDVPPLAQRPLRSEPDPMGPRDITLHRPAQLGTVYRGWLGPEPSARGDIDAMMVACHILAGGETARLVKKLSREQELAFGVGIGISPLTRGRDLVTLSGGLRPEVDPTTFLAQAQAEIAKLGREGPNEEELAKARIAVEADEVFSRDSVFYQAMKIGQVVSIGQPLSELDRMLSGIRAVTKQDVQRVVRRYLDPQKAITATLIPEMPTAGEAQP